MGATKLSDLVTNSHHISNRNIVTNVTKSPEECSDYQSTKRNKSRYSGELARSRADYLAEKLNNPSRRVFYLKCAWNLTDAYLDRLLRIALTKNDPIRYFSASASREMKYNA